MSEPADSSGRVVQRAGDELPVRLEPVLGKPGLQRRDRRPFDADLHVAPVVGVLALPEPLIGDPRATGEADAAVDDERLPVRPVVEPAERVPVDRVVPGDLTAA